LRATTHICQDILVNPRLGSASKLDDKLTAALLLIMLPCVVDSIVFDLEATRLEVYQASTILWVRPNADVQHCGQFDLVIGSFCGVVVTKAQSASRTIEVPGFRWIAVVVPIELKVVGEHVLFAHPEPAVPSVYKQPWRFHRHGTKYGIVDPGAKAVLVDSRPETP
jgi:hypothetical protein